MYSSRHYIVRLVGWHSLWLLVCTAALFVLGTVVVFAAVPAAQNTSEDAARPIHHVFVIVLENKGFDDTFGPDSAAPYFANTLTARGELLTQYYGIGHNSLDNYLAMISGQAPNIATQADCPVFSDFVAASRRPDRNGQYAGVGCVYAKRVQTLANQLTGAGYSWRGYMEDMGLDPARDGGTRCAHPMVNTPDATQRATADDQYAARHDPFVYFHSIIDTPACTANVVPLAGLTHDLLSERDTPNFVFITPNLCHDGHDAPCADGEAGGLASTDDFLREWVPRIVASPAYQNDGLLIITFDESDGPDSDSSACCGEQPGPNAVVRATQAELLPPAARSLLQRVLPGLFEGKSTLVPPGLTGPGGGRTGAVVLSPFIKPGSVNTAAVNHYSLLRSIENLFSLPPLGYARQANLPTFGSIGVYNAGQQIYGAKPVAGTP